MSADVLARPCRLAALVNVRIEDLSSEGKFLDTSKLKLILILAQE